MCQMEKNEKEIMEASSSEDSAEFAHCIAGYVSRKNIKN